MAEKTFSLEDYGITSAGNIPIQDALATFVKGKFEDAKKHKQGIGIESRLLRNLRANKCQYQPDEENLLGPYNDVYIGISALKARAAESWLTDIVMNNIDKPWTLDPTPEPDLPERLKLEVVDMLLAQLPDINSLDALKDRARELKSASMQIAFSKSEEATKKMENKIADQMAEGDWPTAFAGYIAELVAYPSAILRGPVVVQRPQAKWTGNEYKVSPGSLPTVRLVPAFDAYPSPSSTNAGNGEYFIERARYSSADIYSYIGVESFNEGNIRQAINEYPDGYKCGLFTDSERDTLEEKNQDSLQGGNLLETLIYNGVVPGALLAENGILIKDPQKQYECEVWVIGEYVVRAVLNPNPLGTRPLYSTSYRKVTGSFWGQSPICLTYDTMRVCNAAARSLVRNMGFASGPIGEVVSDRVSETEDPLDIRPYRVALVGPDLTGTGAPAYRFHKVDSIAGELRGVVEYYMKLADDLSGIPAYVLGNPQVAGAGRTMGGLSMLMGNAAKGIKNVQLNIDRDVITGVVAGFFMFNMLTSKDDGLKADAKVVARGATGLLQRELAQTRTVEILQLLTPYVTPNPDGSPGPIPPEGIAILLREVLKPTGLPIDDIIPDPKAGQNALDLLKTLGGPEGGGQAPGQEVTMNRGTSEAVPLPPQSLPPPGALTNRPTAVNMPQGA
ncbi:MAG: hypothetical protein V4649_19360 [Bacteroidota bacterium]